MSEWRKPESGNREAATIIKAVRRLRNADTELRRAIAAGDPERTNDAGTSYAIAKFRLFGLVFASEPDNRTTGGGMSRRPAREENKMSDADRSGK